MTEKAVEFDLEVRWEPNAPESMLLSDDNGHTALAVNAHFDDSDQRCVVIRWRGTQAIRSGYPNDEGMGDHPLYRRGVEDIRWAGVVLESMWQAQLGVSGGAQLTHYIVLTKESTFEVLASSWDVLRVAGPTSTAVITALK